MMTRSLNTTLTATLVCAAMVLASGTLQANILINPGFDDDVRTNLGNNLGVSVTGWSTDAPSGSGFNNILVRADGSYNYGGGPNVAQSGTQYLDLHGPATPNALWQTFAVLTDANVTFSAYYSNREANPAGRTANLGIYDATGTTAVSSLVAVDLGSDSKPSTSWTQSPTGAVSLPAGIYQVRTNMDGYMNIDSVLVDAQLTGPKQPIPGLFNTGVDSTGTPLPNSSSSIDPHYSIIVNPDGGGSGANVEDESAFPIAGPWLNNTSISKWIAPRFNTSGAAGGNYTYRTTFDLTGLDPSTASISGLWATDNAGLDILLNGQPTGNANPTQFSAFTPFTIGIGSPFVSGINTLDFQLNNASTGYTGLHVQFSSANAAVIPEPSTLAIWSLGLLGLIGWRRRRTK